MGANLFLQPAVEPVEVGALPENTVLGLEHPVVLIWEDKQLCGQSFHAGSIEGSHALGVVDTVVLLTMDAEDGGVPVLNVLVG